MTPLCEEICIFHFNSLISYGLTGKNILVILQSQYPIELIDHFIHYFSCCYLNWFIFLLQLENFLPTNTYLSHSPNSLSKQSSLSG